MEKHLHTDNSNKKTDFHKSATIGFNIGAEGGTRTHTVLLPLDFESSASASFTTSARHIRYIIILKIKFQYLIFGNLDYYVNTG